MHGIIYTHTHSATFSCTETKSEKELDILPLLWHTLTCYGPVEYFNLRILWTSLFMKKKKKPVHY